MTIEQIQFYTSIIAGLFILLHIPSCNIHWATRLKPFSTFLKQHHRLTLDLATIFAITHLFLAIIILLK
tara:strand:+ start:283 stop:489 length:207 start_codon:yes stop_codon:yes gene_type:complete